MFSVSHHISASAGSVDRSVGRLVLAKMRADDAAGFTQTHVRLYEKRATQWVVRKRYAAAKR